MNKTELVKFNLFRFILNNSFNSNLKSCTRCNLLPTCTLFPLYSTYACSFNWVFKNLSHFLHKICVFMSSFVAKIQRFFSHAAILPYYRGLAIIFASSHFSTINSIYYASKKLGLLLREIKSL